MEQNIKPLLRANNGRSDLKYKVQIPQGIKINLLHNPFLKNTKRGFDINAYLISLFIGKNNKKGRKINDYITLNSSVLRNICGGGYSKYLSVLIELNIIEVFSKPYSYMLNDGTKIKSKGTFSIKFKRSKQYRLKCDSNTPLKEYSITDKHLLSKIDLPRIQKLNQALENPIGQKVYDGLLALTIDKASAIEHVKKLYNFNEQHQWAIAMLKVYSANEVRAIINEILSVKKNKNKLTKVLKKYKIKSTDLLPNKEGTIGEAIVNVVSKYSKIKTRMYWINILDEIQRGNHQYISMSLDNRTNRLFHTLSMTPKNIRQFIKLHNKNLIELDASDCQWHLLIKLCNILCDKSSRSVLSDKYGIRPKGDNMKGDGFDLDSINDFFDRYKYDVERDCVNLKNHLNENLLRPMIVKAFLDEKGKKIDINQAKAYLIKNVLFGNPSNYNYSNWPDVKAFRNAFPFIFKVIVNLKKYWIDESFFDYSPFGSKNESNRFKCLPLILQKMESEVFQEGLSNLNVPFITIHDAVITNEDGKEEVLKALTYISEFTNSNLSFKDKELIPQ